MWWFGRLTTLSKVEGVVSLSNHESRIRKLEEGPDPLARLSARIDASRTSAR